MAEALATGSLILCVDDEVRGLSIRQTLLESAGYRVLTAESGWDALRMFSTHNFDLVILDYQMSEMKGDVVARRMKAEIPDIPILMLSAYADLPQEAVATVDQALPKGEPPAILLKTIAEMLDTGR